MADRGKGANFWFDYAFGILWAENVLSSGMSFSAGQIDIEDILLLRPDVILLDPIPGGLSPRTFYRQPALSIIPAIRSRRVYAVPEWSDALDPVQAPCFSNG